jgi:hypothetical protein
MLRRDNLAGPSVVHSDRVASMTLSVICSRPRGLAVGFVLVAAFVRGFVADFAVVDFAAVFAVVALTAVFFAAVDLVVVDFFGLVVAAPVLGVGTSVLVSARRGNT